MLFNDTYNTIQKSAERLFRDKGSKFLAFSYPIKQLDEVKEHVDLLRGIHPKANHHCWAARVSSDRSVFRINDDGEPSGTAGRPILNALLAAEITDTLIVVVRYFGGTLLGVPRLIHAYRTAATEVLNVSEIIEMTENDVYEFGFQDDNMNNIMRIVKDDKLKIIGSSYSDRHLLTVSIRRSLVNKVTEMAKKIQNIDVKYLYSD